MNDEWLNIFNDRHVKIGVESRTTVHAQGLWHETFHCWFVKLIDSEPHLYFQQRSNVKKDFPGLFDITAAGHLHAHESVSDGIREVEEELGVTLGMNDLRPVGVLKDSIVQGELIDNEFAHTYIFIIENDNLLFNLQPEEVSAIYSATVSEVVRLYESEVDHISMKCIHSNGENDPFIYAKLQDFVPHGDGYMKQILQALKEA